MKTTITIAVLIIAFVLLAKTKISFSPFQIQMEAWRTAVGVFTIILGVCLINVDHYNKGLKEGSDQVFRIVKMMKEQKSKSHE